jgi:hypothetical protein
MEMRGYTGMEMRGYTGMEMRSVIPYFFLHGNDRIEPCINNCMIERFTQVIVY